MRQQHLEQDLLKSDYTIDLYKQYRKHLGSLRYRLLCEGQKLVVPPMVMTLLSFGSPTIIKPLLYGYKFSRRLKVDWLLKSIILPAAYKSEIKNLDVAHD
jgi:hypothetical protein